MLGLAQLVLAGALGVGGIRYLFIRRQSGWYLVILAACNGLLNSVNTLELSSRAIAALLAATVSLGLGVLLIFAAGGIIDKRNFVEGFVVAVSFTLTQVAIWFTSGVHTLFNGAPLVGSLLFTVVLGVMIFRPPTDAKVPEQYVAHLSDRSPARRSSPAA